VVLCYHSIPDALADRFRKQVDIICRSVEPLPAGFKGTLSQGKRYVMVTFDDGFENVIKNALPELNRRAVPCAIFPVTGAMGALPGWIKNPWHPDTSEHILEGSQLSLLNSSLVAVGSHGVSHRSFLRMTPEEASTELRQSKSTLEAWVGQEVDLFAFPHGEYNAAATCSALQEGYRRLFGLSYNIIRDSLTDPVISRFDADPSDWILEFKLKLFGAYRWLPIVFRIKKRLVSAINYFQSSITNRGVKYP
jgi:peptidoglycan/xylan/chitin deacetylase (PgdA/CDA1 family)